MTRTSLGPYGLNKFIVNYIDKLYLTKDTGTMIKEVFPYNLFYYS